MDYIHVKNIEKYHPAYKDRELIWCKTYFTMVNADPEFEMLGEVDKWRFIAFVMLELQIKKPIPIDESYFIRKGFDLESRPISLTIQMLHNFIECVTDDSKVCYESVTYIREDKSREEGVTQTPVTKSKIPSKDQVLLFFKNSASENEGVKFWEYYEMVGWVVGKARKPIKNWEMAAHRWIKNNTQTHAPRKQVL